MLLQDGDAAGVAVGAEVLQDDRGGHLGVEVEHRGDGVGVRIELRADGDPLVAGWLGKLKQPDHRGAAHP